MPLTRLLCWSGVALVALAVGCTKEPVRPSRAPMPSNVVAVVTIPSVAEFLRDAGQYVDQVDAARSIAMENRLDEFVRGAEASAIDRSKPLHLVLLNPRPGATAWSPVLVVATTKDAKTKASIKAGNAVKMSRGWVVIGQDQAVVDSVSPWALSTLTDAPPPARTHASIYPPAAMTTPWMDELRAKIDGESPNTRLIWDAVLTLLEQTERIDVDVEIESSRAIIELAAVPRTGTRMASVLAEQKPATFAILERLPLADASVAIGGSVSAGPLKELSSIAISIGVDAPEGVRAMFDHLSKNLTGEFGVSDVGAGSIVATSRAAIPLSPDHAVIIADARSRRDSALVILQRLPFNIAPAVVGLGVRDGSAHVWASLPAAQLADLALP